MCRCCSLFVVRCLLCVVVVWCSSLLFGVFAVCLLLLRIVSVVACVRCLLLLFGAWCCFLCWVGVCYCVALSFVVVLCRLSVLPAVVAVWLPSVLFVGVLLFVAVRCCVVVDCL